MIRVKRWRWMILKLQREILGNTLFASTKGTATLLRNCLRALLRLMDPIHPSKSQNASYLLQTSEIALWRSRIGKEAGDVCDD